MRKKILFALVVIVSVLALTGALYAQETDPESVTRAIIDALNAKDIDLALTYVADDVVEYIVPPPPGSTGIFTGKEELRGWWEYIVSENALNELTTCQVNGETATCSLDYWDDGMRALDVTPVKMTGELVVRGGLLHSVTWTITDESLAKIDAAMAALELPETGVGPPPAKPVPLWLEVGGLLVALGLALRWASRHARSPR